MKFSLDKDLKPAVGVTVVLFLLRLVFVAFGPIDLSPDEAHYWEWSRYLDWSYYSKPPLVAWLNYLSTSVFGHTPIGVRFFSCLGLSILSLLAYLIAWHAHGQKAGWIALLLINLTPEFAAGGLMMTPDVPSLVFWALGLYLLTRIDFEKNELSLKPFIILGLVIGFAGLAKYTTALFYPLLAIYLLGSKQRRVWLWRPPIYIAGVISLLMQAPVFYWNYIHDFIGLKHVMGQSGGSSDFSGLKSLGNFLGGQLGVLSPLTFILLLCAWFFVGRLLLKKMGGKNEDKRYKTLELLWYFSAPIFIAFVIKSYGAKVQPNWPILSIYGGFVLLAIWVTDAGKWWQRTFIFGLVLSTLLTVISHDTFIVRKVLKMVGSDIKIPFKRDPLKPVLGWRGLGQAISAKIKPVLNGKEPLVLTTRYQTASELSFYMQGNPHLLYVNPGYRRQNQYDLWPWPQNMQGRTVIYVRENKTIEPFILKAFSDCAYLGAVASQRDNILMRTAHVYACFGFKGLERIRPEKY